jgi:Domain of unknown function (DUF5069)
MDLTKTYPRSVKAKFAGLYMLGRTTDKARAFNAGSLGEYHYNCGMDQKAFAFLGVDHETFAKKVTQLRDDSAIEGWVKESFLKTKSGADIEAYNKSLDELSPAPASDGEKYFLELRTSLAPKRTDITTWADLLDLDEHRDVPIKAAA